eukprot:IDg6648t1
MAFTSFVNRSTITNKNLFLRRVGVSSPSRSIAMSSRGPDGGNALE